MSLARDLPTPVQTAIASGEALYRVYFGFFDFVGDPTYVHSSVGIINHDGHDWLPLAGRGGLSPVIEELDGKTTSTMMRMGGVDTDLINHARNLDYEGRTAQVLVGFLSFVSGDVIGATEVRYGEIKDVSFKFGQYGQPSYIDIEMIDEISQLDQTRGLYWDQPSLKQRLGNSTSTLCKHTPRLETLDIRLGPVTPAKRRTEGLVRHEKIGRLF